jgi:hypothetical protein
MVLLNFKTLKIIMHERPWYAGSSCKYLGTIEGLFCCYFVLREKNITDFSVSAGYVFF